MNYVEVFLFMITCRCYLLFAREGRILYKHQHRRRVDMKIFLVLTLKMYTVIFVHLIFFVCK